MTAKSLKWYLFLLIFFIANVNVSAQRHGKDRTMISGRVVSSEKEIIDFATVILKGTNIKGMTNSDGIYHLEAPAGNYKLVVTAVGYKKTEKKVTLTDGQRTKLNITLTPEVKVLDGVTVVSTGVNRVRKSAFNAVAVDTRELHNTTKTLSEALAKTPGMKLRESGGVGSDMQLMLDGYSGRHVKVFVDGLPQEGAGAGLDLNNIPINFAERIEVYKGVVPVGFGTDAIGGVINVVTNRHRRKWFVDASYSYGSFNTHKSYVNFGQMFKSGLTYEVNAYQNYSDNDYSIDYYVRDFNVAPDGTVTFPPLDKNKIYKLKRFNDMFHNEAVVGRIGFLNKSWADKLMFSLTYTHFYKEIQNGVYQYAVFGEKHRHGHSIVPSLEYKKRNLFVKNLDLSFSANFNHNITMNVDTASRAYNWRGEYYEKGSRGEQSYQNNEMKSQNWNTALNVAYRIGEAHTFMLNNTISNFRRTTRAYEGTSSSLTDYTIPKVTRKNITGLSYRFMPSEKWNVSVFGKYYNQYNRGPVSQNADGVGNYTNMSQTVGAWGYGAAGTYYPLKDLQVKLSYEKAYRLPTTDELFGDEDLEAGKANLKPENSDNLNLNISYNRKFGMHGLYAEAGLVYRDTKDYIQRGLDQIGGTSYGYYENHGHVKTTGYNVSLRYNFSRWFNLGGTYNDISTRDYERYLAGSTQQESMHYKVRMPNTPYRFANLDANFYWHDLFDKGNVLSVSYDGFWQHDFPLFWENIGSKDTKNIVPEQFSHNISLSYSVKNGKYNFSFECRNVTNAKLYDNFSLQKAGRAFYGKFRVYLSK